jgi:hypothetical protein
MSLLRQVATLQKEEPDPSKPITFSFPSSLIARIDQVMSETGLGRSAVAQALVKDGLVEYINDPLKKAVSDAESAMEHVDSMDVPPALQKAFPEQITGDQMCPSEVIELALSRMEENRKAVWA